MWRVIIRLSFDKDANLAMRNGLEIVLRNAGIGRTTTGTWECPVANADEAAWRIGEMLSKLVNPAMTAGLSSDFVLDHAWIYIDRGPADADQP